MGDSESETSSEEKEEEHIRRELLDVPLGQLQALRERIGMKKFDSALRESTEKVPKQRKFKRDNKNKPREMPSHRPVSRFRQVVPVQKPTSRDPRFGERSGTFNQTMFKKAYSFLDGMKEKERKMAEKELHRTKDPERKCQLHRLVQKMESEKLAEKTSEEKRAQEKDHRKTERELQKGGKRPFFLKKSVRRQLELAERYKQLKASGRLDKYLAKKRRRNAQRDRRQLPFKKH